MNRVRQLGSSMLLAGHSRVLKVPTLIPDQAQNPPSVRCDYCRNQILSSDYTRNRFLSHNCNQILHYYEYDCNRYHPYDY